MEYKIALIAGDGIGPEIVKEAQKVLDACAEKYGYKFAGWYTDSSCQKTFAFNSPVSNDCVLYAKFLKKLTIPCLIA